MRGRRELQAVAVAIVLVILGDLLVGLVGSRLTADAQHIDEIPGLVAALADDEATTVLFLGNSVTRRGIQPDLFEQVAAANGEVRVAAIHPDDTTIADWPFAYDHFIAAENLTPDLVIVPFITGQLRDDRPLDPRRIGRDYTSVAELGDRLAKIDGLAGRGELLAASRSNIFANRERISRRVLDVIPGYRELAQDLNDAAVQQRDEELVTVSTRYERLAGLDAEVRDGGGRLIVVAMPTSFRYDVDPDLIDAAADLGVELIDLRDLELVDADYRDDIHLAETGAEKVTTELARVLQPLP